MAKRIGVGQCTPTAATRSSAREISRRSAQAGKVHSGGLWRQPAAHARLADALGTPLEAALKPDFEWYFCRGAFFHNDAHYDARLFGIWCIQAHSIDLVFPRAAVRVPLQPGAIVVFDPFEVHGVLTQGCTEYAAADYRDADTAVFLGFEVALTRETAAVLDICHEVAGPVISSRTRICANSGAIEFS